MSKSKTPVRDTAAMDRLVLDGTTEITEALHRFGHLSDAQARASQSLRRKVGARPLSLRRPGPLSLAPPAELSPEAIRTLREREGASQAVLAKHLGVATATLGQWERGLRKPDGPALRLLALVERHGLAYIAG